MQDGPFRQLLGGQDGVSWVFKALPFDGAIFGIEHEIASVEHGGMVNVGNPGVPYLCAGRVLERKHATRRELQLGANWQCCVGVGVPDNGFGGDLVERDGEEVDRGVGVAGAEPERELTGGRNSVRRLGLEWSGWILV